MSLSSQESPLVSIVIPCYNHAQFVQETIQSVIDQDYENIELIIIDDGSKDNSVEVIQEMIPACEKRFVRFEFRYRPNKGLCATLNEALEWCEGKYYSAIASDDVMNPDKCSIQVDFLLNNPYYDAVFGSAHIIDSNGKIIGNNKKRSEDIIFEDLFLVAKTISAPTQMIKLSAIQAAGKYPVGEYIEDWYMWLRLTSLGFRLKNIDSFLVSYRRHGNNISNSIDEMSKSALKIIEEYKYHTLYEKALASRDLSKAIALQASNKNKSLNYFIKYIKVEPFGFLHKRAFLYILKIFIPRFFLSKRL